MATRKMNTMEFIETLRALDRGYFTVADLEKITGLSRNSLKVALSRMVKQRLLVRLRRGVYQLGFSSFDPKKIANQLYYPSYLSFESALSYYGILSQVPFTQTFATIKKSKKMKVGDFEVEFTQIRKDLFFGYVLKNGIYIAQAEKALLDQLYLAGRGKRLINIKELDLKNINREKLGKYADLFPSYVNDLLGKMEKYIGTTPVTNDTKERILW